MVGNVATAGIIAAGTVAAVDSIGQNSGVKTYGDSSPATKTSTSTSSKSIATSAGDGSASSSPAPALDPVITPATEPVVITP
jgi:hypothetical protein